MTASNVFNAYSCLKQIKDIQYRINTLNSYSTDHKLRFSVEVIGGRHPKVALEELEHSAELAEKAIELIVTSLKNEIESLHEEYDKYITCIRATTSKIKDETI